LTCVDAELLDVAQARLDREYRLQDADAGLRAREERGDARHLAA
jgi:hypothetical protein